MTKISTTIIVLSLTFLSGLQADAQRGPDLLDRALSLINKFICNPKRLHNLEMSQNVFYFIADKFAHTGTAYDITFDSSVAGRTLTYDCLMVVPEDQNLARIESCDVGDDESYVTRLNPNDPVDLYLLKGTCN